MKNTVELGAAAALAAVVLGGFYHQGGRIDAQISALAQGQNAQISELDMRIDRLDMHIDKLGMRLYEVSERLARIEGILDGWLSQPPLQPANAVLRGADA